MPGKPWATGNRLEFLTSRKTAYIEALQCGSKPQFLIKLNHDWFATYAWDLSDDLEPGADYERRPELEKEARVVKKKLSLARWFYTRIDQPGSGSTEEQRSGHAGGFPPIDPSALSLNNPKFKLTRPPKPRLKQSKHMYSELYYKKHIQAIATSKWRSYMASAASEPDKPTIGFFEMSQRVTKDMWALESPQVKAEVEMERVKRHKKALIAYKASEIAMTTAEGYQKAIDNMVPYINTFLKGLAERTGLSATLAVGGPVPSNNGQIGTYHYHCGSTAGDNPINFGAYAHTFLDNNFFAIWSEFLKKVYPRDERDAFYGNFTQAREESLVAAASTPSQSPSRSTTPGTSYGLPESLMESSAPFTLVNDCMHGNSNSTPLLPLSALPSSIGMSPTASNGTHGAINPVTTMQPLLDNIESDALPTLTPQNCAHGMGNTGTAGLIQPFPAPTLPTSAQETTNPATTMQSLPCSAAVNSRVPDLAGNTPLSLMQPSGTQAMIDSAAGELSLSLPGGLGGGAVDLVGGALPLSMTSSIARGMFGIGAVVSPPSAMQLDGVTDVPSIRPHGEERASELLSIHEDILSPNITASLPMVIDYELQRLNNIRENKILMAKLGLGPDSATSIIHTTSTGRKRRPSKRKRDADSNLSDKRRATRAKPNLPSITSSTAAGTLSKAELKGVPPWLVLFVDFVSRDNLGPDWLLLVKSWLAIEKELAYLTKSSRLFNSKNRPPAISTWMTHGRKCNVSSDMIEITDITEFSELWWKWWTTSQPLWRSKNKDGELLQTGSGDWSSLKVGGNNGLILFIVALCWWGKAVVDCDNSQWVKAVKDVQWALEGCVS